jgi:tellurite resistance protein TerA
MSNRIDLVPGQNCPLPATSLHVTISHGQGSLDITVDVSAFLLNSQGKVATDDDFIFFNQPARPELGILLEPEQGRFTLHLDRTGNNIQKIALAMTITITDGQAKGQNFSLLKNITVLVKDFLTGIEIACFPLDTRQNLESALIVAELYRHQDKWKFRAVGQGFIGGLQPLAEFFGVDVGAGESSPAPVSADKVNLSKITLEKKGQSVSLTKNAGDAG